MLNISYSFRHILLVACLLLLASCSVTPKQDDTSSTDHSESLWQSHQERLGLYSDWNVKGRAALRSAKDSWSAALSWQQQEQDFTLKLSGPFGQGAVRIDSEGEAVSVHIAGQQPVTTNSAEALLDEQFGWNVPVAALHYWLRGLPAPGEVEELSLSIGGLAQNLKQFGWQIEYSEYRPLRGLPLPRKISVENSELRLKLALNRWHVEGLDASALGS